MDREEQKFRTNVQNFALYCGITRGYDLVQLRSLTELTPKGIVERLRCNSDKNPSLWDSEIVEVYERQYESFLEDFSQSTQPISQPESVPPIDKMTKVEGRRGRPPKSLQAPNLSGEKPSINDDLQDKYRRMNRQSNTGLSEIFSRIKSSNNKL
ncbi:hypothetical protein HYT24_00490 [Candidatus Pacearchaeota archaeon]|nr:hypothetical protein [Candidatus Pacearchaeota archaeon]